MPRIYPIVRWDAIQNQKGSTHAQPAVYIEPTPDTHAYLLNLYNKQGLAPIQLTGTDSTYEQQLAYASVQPSEVTGGYRPNYQADTCQWAILPHIVWQGYPRSLGQVTLLEDSGTGTGAQTAYGPVSAIRLTRSETRYWVAAVALFTAVVGGLWVYDRARKKRLMRVY
jgi:hypothetical protein